MYGSLSARRAWIEIRACIMITIICTASLSARRAWIEICGGACAKRLALVALRKESVDRNRNSQYSYFLYYGSLSARRAWIEIWSAVLTELLILVALRKESVDRNYKERPGQKARPNVALRKESVDRNMYSSLHPSALMGRSPQGERG